MGKGNIFIFSLFTIISCGKNNIDKVTFDHLDPWSYSDVLRGSLKSKVTSGSTKTEIFIHYNEEFPFENIYIKYVLKDGLDTLENRIISIPLQNEMGQWLGKKKNNCYVMSHILLDSIPSNNGLIDFEIIQYSRENDLSGINRISVALVKDCR